MAELRVRLQPRAGRNEIVGERAGTLVVRVAAAPVEGKANDALLALIAKHAGVGRTRVTLVRGVSSRDKLLRVEGVSEKDLRRALGIASTG